METEATAKTWAAGLAQAGSLAARDRADETDRVTRALDRALMQEDRQQVLAQFDRAVVLLSAGRRWHDGLAIARQVYDAVAGWADLDPAPYASTVAQFAHNYAIELQGARLFEAAEEFYGQALHFFRASGDLERQMVTSHQLGRLHQDRGNYAQAEQSYRESLEIARRLSDHTRIAKNIFQLGQLAQIAGEDAKARSLYADVLSIADQIADDRLFAAVEHQLAILAQTAREYSEARRLFESALQRADEGGDSGTMIDARHHLGILAHAQGDLVRAEEMYHAALALTRRSGRPAEAGPTLYQLAQVALARADFAGAIEYARQSLEVFQSRGDLGAIRRLQELLRHLESRLVSNPSC